MSEQKPQGRMEFWAIVELMGHQRLAGFVQEVPLGAAAMIRVDVPETSYIANDYESIDGRYEQVRKEVTIPAFTKFVAPGSLYAITPCSEETAKAAVQQFRSRPVAELNIVTSKALPAPERDDEDEDEEADPGF